MPAGAPGTSPTFGAGKGVVVCGCIGSGRGVGNRGPVNESPG